MLTVCIECYSQNDQLVAQVKNDIRAQIQSIGPLHHRTVSEEAYSDTRQLKLIEEEFQSFVCT